MPTKSRNKTKNLPGDVLGIVPYLTRNNIPGVRLYYKNKAFVVKKRSLELVESVTAAAVNAADVEAMQTPDLILAIRTLVGVQDAWNTVVNYLLPQVEATSSKRRKNAKRK